MKQKHAIAMAAVVLALIVNFIVRSDMVSVIGMGIGILFAVLVDYEEKPTLSFDDQRLSSLEQRLTDLQVTLDVMEAEHKKIMETVQRLNSQSNLVAAFTPRK